MRLAPAISNPFAMHPLPMQEGRRLLAEGRIGDASLAFEAAVLVTPLEPPFTPRNILAIVLSNSLFRVRRHPAGLRRACSWRSST